MIPEVGQRFGPYEILGRLGSGGMGLVFRAWDGRLQRQVAVKLLHNDYKMPAMRERFLQEARAASGLNHPNICTIFDIGDQGGDPYLVMELLEGETLKERIARGALPAEEIVTYAKEVADALEVAHVKGIVHRDIKPANIFLVKMPNGKSQAKVLDFGLAKIGLTAQGGWGSRRLDLTLAGSTVGTLAYMSPEQARGEALDARSDLFSLGVVMYEMATRQVPFKGTTSAIVLVHLMHHEPDRVRSWNETIPSELERVIMRLLAKNRRGRFQTAKELQEALGRLAKKISRAWWLQKGATTAVVPLVLANDPVAREKRLRKRPSGEREGAVGAAGAGGAVGTGGAGDSSGKTPVASVGHSPLPSDGGHGGGGPLTTDSGGVVTEDEKVLARLEGAAAESETSAWERVAAIAKSRSGAMDLAYELDEVKEQEALLAARVGGDKASSGRLAKARGSWSVIRATGVAAAVVVVVGGIFLLVRSGRFLPPVLEPGDGMLLTVIQNKTGDKTLDGTVTDGLELALRQSSKLKVMGGETYRAGLRQIEAESGDAAKAASARRVAEKVGAKEYLYGEIKGEQAPYTIDVDVLNAESNDKLASLEETAESRDQIPAAIGRLAMELRSDAGESGGSGTGSVPLERDATANVDALHAFSVGEAMRETGRAGDALTAYQQAVELDPRFAQALMRLAWLYRSQKAETAAANAAAEAQTAAAHSSEKVRLLADVCFQVNATGDYGQALAAIRRLARLYPHDAEVMHELALVLRLRGEFPEALQAAQASYGYDPFNAEAYKEAELAMVGMDRFEGALELEAQAQRFGVTTSANALTAGYLAGKQDVVAEQVKVLQSATPGTGQVMYSQVDDYGRYLDNIGQMSAGDVVWSAAATKADSVLEFTSTRASLLAQGALDSALVERCNQALSLAMEVKDMERGPVASFHAGMAAALCGDLTYAEKMAAELLESYPRSTAVTEYYVPNLEAAAEIGVNEPAKALEKLAGLGKYDQVSLTPYLRGLAHEAMGQMPLAVDDFQTVLAHRGVAFKLSGDLYPMAKIRLARAFAANGNKPDSVATYKSFLEGWSSDQPKDALVAEAVLKSRD